MKFNNASGRVSFLKNQQLVWSESHRNAQTQARSHTILPKGEANKCLRYIKLLGHGSYGVVDSVEGNFSGVEYARKLVYTASSYRRRERVTALKEEIQSLKRLRHHHLIQYVGSYADDTVLAFLMLPVAECNLQTWIQNQPPQNSVREFFGCLASALAYLHKESIRHKDIKPQNILVHRNTVLLTDFGSAHDWKDLDGSTTTGIAKDFTRKYASPEVLQHESRNSSSDVFSLGCVFLELASVLCGFTVDSLHQHLREHLLAESNGGLFSSNHTALELWTGTLHNETALTSDSEILTLILGMLNYDQHSRPNAPQIVSTIRTIGQKYMCRSCHIKRITQYFEGRNIPVGTPDQRGQAICEACCTRDLATLRSLLMISDNMDYVDINGGTALDISVNSGSEEVTEVLLGHCRAENWIPNSSSALSKALKIGNLTLLQNLISCGLDPNQTYNNKGLLHLAIRYKNIQAAGILLQYGADINMKDGDHWRSTPLHVAARTEKPEFAGLLLRHGANANATDLDEFTPLHYAASNGELSIVNLLLQAKLDPNMRRKGNSALHLAVFKGHDHLIEPLIKAGADPGLQNDEGFTASCIAASRGDFDTLQAIMKCASRGIHRSRWGTTPLHHAVSSENESVVELLLLETPEDLQIQDNDAKRKSTPLHGAAWIGNETILRMLLLQENPPTRVENAKNFIPLVVAIYRGRKAEVIRLLIDRDPETLNMREHKSWLPLHQACNLKSKRLDLVQLLIEKGADVNGRNKTGFTALQVAAFRPGSEEILEFLLDKGALVDITN